MTGHHFLGAIPLVSSNTNSSAASLRWAGTAYRAIKSR